MQTNESDIFNLTKKKLVFSWWGQWTISKVGLRKAQFFNILMGSELFSKWFKVKQSRLLRSICLTGVEALLWAICEACTSYVHFQKPPYNQRFEAFFDFLTLKVDLKVHLNRAFFIMVCGVLSDVNWVVLCFLFCMVHVFMYWDKLKGNLILGFISWVLS